MLKRILSPARLFGLGAVALVAAAVIPPQTVKAQQTFKAPPSPGQSGSTNIPGAGGSSNALGNNKPRSFAAPPSPGGGSTITPAPPPGGNPNTSKRMIDPPPPGQAAINGSDGNKKNKWKRNNDLAVGHDKNGKAKASTAPPDGRGKGKKNGDVAVGGRAKLKDKGKNAATLGGSKDNKKRRDFVADPRDFEKGKRKKNDVATGSADGGNSSGSADASPLEQPGAQTTTTTSSSLGGGNGSATPPSPGATTPTNSAEGTSVDSGAVGAADPKFANPIGTVMPRPEDSTLGGETSAADPKFANPIGRVMPRPNQPLIDEFERAADNARASVGGAAGQGPLIGTFQFPGDSGSGLPPVTQMPSEGTQIWPLDPLVMPLSDGTSFTTSINGGVMVDSQGNTVLFLQGLTGTSQITKAIAVFPPGTVTQATIGQLRQELTRYMKRYAAALNQTMLDYWRNNPTGGTGNPAAPPSADGPSAPVDVPVVPGGGRTPRGTVCVPNGDGTETCTVIN